MEYLCEGNHKYLVDLLIKEGQTSLQDWNGGLKGAARGGNRKLIDLMLKMGADDILNGIMCAKKGTTKYIIRKSKIATDPLVYDRAWVVINKQLENEDWDGGCRGSYSAILGMYEYLDVPIDKVRQEDEKYAASLIVSFKLKMPSDWYEIHKFL
jgi:hypothetical protein